MSKDTKTYWQFRWLMDCGYIGLSKYTRKFLCQLADTRFKQLGYGGQISEHYHLKDFNV